MQISVAGKGVDVGESLRTHIEQRLEQGLNKYTDRVTSAHTIISKEAHRFRIDINGNLGTHAGIVVRAQALGDDPYAAFDAALEKIEKQLRRYKRRISNHHKQSMGGAEAQFLRGKKYVLTPTAAEEEDAMQAGAVIAEKPTDIATLTVSEAVMRMDLQDLPALMFFNAAHGRINVVYRRADGNISWVDPESQAA